MWNTNSFLDLLLDTYPKESVKSKGLGNFHQVMNKINPLYNYDDAKEEQKTVRNILILQKQYGFDNIAVTEEKQAVKAVIGKWPKMVQENFKAYVGGGSSDTLSQWIDHFLGWCSRARHAKATAESTLYTVSASRFTVFLKFNAEEKESYKEIPGWNRAENRSQKRALENNNHNSGGGLRRNRMCSIFHLTRCAIIAVARVTPTMSLMVALLLCFTPMSIRRGMWHLSILPRGSFTVLLL